MTLSHDIKESIKTALAMTIAYGIGLLDFVDVAANVDWAPWHEERFV